MQRDQLNRVAFILRGIIGDLLPEAETIQLQNVGVGCQDSFDSDCLGANLGIAFHIVAPLFRACHGQILY